MNLYIWLHSTDQYDTEEYIKLSKKCCIVCMPSYIYDDYVYFKNMTDTPNEHHNNFILNQIPDFNITSPFKWCYNLFELLPKLSIDTRLKSYVDFA